MTKKRLTYKDLLQQRGKKLFVGREEEREAFRRNFGCEVPEHLIFAIHGQAGIGKSFLVARYQMIARENGALKKNEITKKFTRIKQAKNTASINAILLFLFSLSSRVSGAVKLFYESIYLKNNDKLNTKSNS